MTQIAIEAGYHTAAIGYANLPDGKTWNDVEDWYVKWDYLHVKFKGQNDWVELCLNSDSFDGTDWKRPIWATIYPCNEDGDVMYEAELDSQES